MSSLAVPQVEPGTQVCVTCRAATERMLAVAFAVSSAVQETWTKVHDRLLCLKRCTRSFV